MKALADMAARFQELHRRPGAFVIPNPWDAGTARLLASLGFEALATTSLGLAITLGRGSVTPVEILDNCKAIADATKLPVNADLENCGAHDPRAAAEMIRLAFRAGVVGGSIEDATGDPDKPIYDFALAVERVQAAAEVARSLPVPFMLTARAENLINGRDELDDTIRRLQAFEAAGADVLYAPGLKDLATIKTVVSAVGKPVNVVMSHADPSLTVADLAEAGVKRISVGGSIARHLVAAFLNAGREMKEKGAFTFLRDAPPSKQIKAAFAAGAGAKPV
jgi:2-methylisocitrate lyase-like PEP mutase family enzyme